MTPDHALSALAETALLASRASDVSGAQEALLDLAVSASQAREGFLAKVEGGGLRWTCGVARTGDASEPAARQLERVSVAVQEALDGVAEAPPPHMTGGEAPPGAVAVKAEAGHPPIHAFPLLDATGAWVGVLGLVPDPAAPADVAPTAGAVLTVLTQLFDVDHFPVSSGPEPTASTDPLRANLKFDYSEIVSRSEKLATLFGKLDRVIPAKVPILVCGETGTGKELIARAIHRNDPSRRHKRLYTQNCGAIPATLLESELFGYMPGAFTGAETRKKGLFEIADGSTLFLDEIGEMSVDMQTRFLRVLQEKEVLPIGASEPVPVDVRLVAATLRDLEGDIKAGRFREDLYYRLKVVRLNLPPLRDRPEDISPLIDHFLRKAAIETGKAAKVLDRRDPRIMEALAGYRWPGNVRELENVSRRLAHLAPEDVITYEALVEAAPDLVGNVGASNTREVRPLDEVVEEVEREEIENALRVTNNNRTQAAKLLGINRRSLLRRLQKYGYAVDDTP